MTMVRINRKKLEELFEKFKSEMGDALVASDIWDRKTATPIIAHNTQPVAVALFNRISEYLDKTLEESHFPPVNRYYLIDTVDNKVVVIVYLHPEFIQGILADISKIQIGLLINYIVPMMIEGFKEVVEES